MPPGSVCPATKEDYSALLFYCHSYTLKCPEVEPISMKNTLGLNYTLVTSALVAISYISFIWEVLKAAYIMKAANYL